MNTNASPPDLLSRRHPVHGVKHYRDQPTLVFVTVCTQHRKRWLTCEEAHAELVGIWSESAAWRVGKYLLMPDHVHFFCAPANPEILFDNWMKFWKRAWSRRLGCPDWKWQDGYWDTRLRQGESYHEKWLYVQQNPVRAGLVKTADEWPYQGALNTLRW